MATGIVSLGARQEGLPLLSSVLLWLTGALYALLFAYHAARFARQPRRVIAELRTGAIFDYLTGVAAGCVLASGLLLAGAPSAPAWVLFVLSGLIWLTITAIAAVELLVIRSLHPRSEVQGGWLLAVVAPQALSVLALDLADGPRADALGAAALVLWLLAGALYPAIAWLRLRRLESGRRAWASLRSDDWILMGALAISTLAGSELLERLARHGAPLADVRPLVLWAVVVQFTCACCLTGLLLWGEARHATTPAALRGDIPPATRWASVFPLGMLAVACHAFASSTNLTLPRTLGDVVFAIALAAWLATAAVAAVERLGNLHVRC